MPETFKVGEAPWETQKQTFKVGEAPWEKERSATSVSGRGLLKGTIEALPAAGAIAGGAIGTVLGPAGILGGGALGAGIGKGLENLAERYLLGEEKTREQTYMDPVREMATDAAFGAGGMLLGKVGKGAYNLSKGPIDDMVQRMSPDLSPRASQIKAAGEALDIQPTRGMLTEDDFVGSLENVLSKRMTKAGGKVRDQYKNFYEGIDRVTDEIVNPQALRQSPVSLGEEAKGLIGKGVDEKLAPATDFYKSAKEATPYMDVVPKTAERVSKNILKIPDAKFSEGSLLRQAADDVSKITNIDELRSLKTQYGSIAGDPTKPALQRKQAGEVFGKLQRMEQSNILRNSVETMGDDAAGKSVARGFIKDMKAANKVYGETSKSMKKLAEDMKLGKVRNTADFVRKIQDLPEEKLLEKIFDENNFKGAQRFQKEFPEVFEKARVAKAQKYMDRAIMDDGSVNAKRLIREIDKIKSPEMKKMLFGDQALKKISNLKTLLSAMPDVVNPSGTAQALDIMDGGTLTKGLNPKAWLDELDDYFKGLALRDDSWLQNMAKNRRKKDLLKTLRDKSGATTSKGLIGTRVLPRAVMSGDGDE